MQFHFLVRGRNVYEGGCERREGDGGKEGGEQREGEKDGVVRGGRMVNKITPRTSQVRAVVEP